MIPPLPPVLFYERDKTSFQRIAYSFSSWLASAAQEEIAAKAGLRK